MRLEHTPRPEQTLRVSARLITSSTILHLTGDELERAVNQEEMENPTLEVAEQRICLFCGARLYGQTCIQCGHHAEPTQPLPNLNEGSINYDIPLATLSNTQQQLYDSGNYGFAEIESDDEFDPLASIPMGETLAEVLLHQLETLISPEDGLIAEQLVGNLNERGYLEISTDEIAAYLEVSQERVEYVLSQLHTLEPVGIGARTLRECLLIQLEALSEQEKPHPLAHPLIDHYLERLGRGQFHEIGRELNVAEQEVREASLYIRSTLNPFPAHTYQADMPFTRSTTDATFVRPDVIIRQGANGFEVELIEERRYHFSISSDQLAQQAGETPTSEVQRYLHHASDHAKFFIECVHRRWHTLKQVATLVVDYQHDFLEHGIRHLRPLTRAEVASRLNLDEGTVSRATANKYALLPNGRLIPLSDFFDSSLGLKDILRELIQFEDPKHRLSDDELAKQMQTKGYPMARRTVTKYREEMGIGSSRERG
ncbi:MAG: RNA polymerase factor sigma-54 [Ktedonobacteraceae bacterium]